MSPYTYGPPSVGCDKELLLFVPSSLLHIPLLYERLTSYKRCSLRCGQNCCTCDQAWFDSRSKASFIVVGALCNLDDFLRSIDHLIPLDFTHNRLLVSVFELLELVLVFFVHFSEARFVLHLQIAFFLPDMIGQIFQVYFNFICDLCLSFIRDGLRSSEI